MTQFREPTVDEIERAYTVALSMPWDPWREPERKRQVWLMLRAALNEDDWTKSYWPVPTELREYLGIRAR